MIDVNQGWTLDEASVLTVKYAAFPLIWIEEPLGADRPRSEWDALAAASPVPLAVGENLRGLQAFKAVITAGYARYIQPDACKWGGVSSCTQVATEALAAGRVYCPHYLGGGIGLLTSAHLLAAAGGEGLMEIDVNPNPLRELLADPYPALRDGRLFLTDKPGIGVTPLLDEVKTLRKFHRRLH